MLKVYGSTLKVCYDALVFKRDALIASLCDWPWPNNEYFENLKERTFKEIKSLNDEIENLVITAEKNDYPLLQDRANMHGRMTRSYKFETKC